MRTLTSVGWIHVRDDRLLAVRTDGRDRFYLPGGKPEAAETFEAALAREVHEELGLVVEGIRFEFTVTALAHGHDDETRVVMHCFRAETTGVPRPAREIAELTWLGLADRALAAPAVQVVLDRLAATGPLG
jgi:8-oxo-dGTP diphosphatase